MQNSDRKSYHYITTCLQRWRQLNIRNRNIRLLALVLTGYSGLKLTNAIIPAVIKNIVEDNSGNDHNHAEYQTVPAAERDNDTDECHREA
jgi:hypothetical protein